MHYLVLYRAGQSSHRVSYVPLWTKTLASYSRYQTLHPTILLAIHNLDIGVSALFATDTTSTDHRESCVAFYREKKRTRKLIQLLHCFESQTLFLFSGVPKANIQEGPEAQHSAPNRNFPQVQGSEDLRFCFSSEVWPSVSLKLREVWIKVQILAHL